MDQTIISNLNAVVKPDDTLYHLGDFAFANWHPYRARIHCQDIRLILGNHDGKRLHGNQSLFNSVSHYEEIQYNRTSIVLCHYAMRVWNKSHYGSYMLYGHSHGTLKDLGNKSFDVGVDCWDYKPLSINQIIKEMDKRTTEVIDHHGN